MMEIMDGKSPTVDSMDKGNKFSKGFKNFIAKCLVKDAQKRLSATELLQSEFIRKNAKDRQFMKEKFVKFIKPIHVKKCGKHDMPSSLAAKYEVKVDQDEAVDETPSNPDFTFSTSVRLEADDLKPSTDDTQISSSEAATDKKTEKKGKFMVTTISNEDEQQSQNAKKSKAKFTVTTVDDDDEEEENNNSQKPKSKSRF